MKLLKNEILVKYDYKKTKANVDKYMDRFGEDYFKYIGVLPPNITSHLCEVKVQTSRTLSSSVERYVVQKIELEGEREFIDYLNTIFNIVDNFTEEEQHYFKGVYFLGNNENIISEELRCAIKKLIHIKKSCIIKFALAINQAVRK